jgi:hypothetical protein
LTKIVKNSEDWFALNASVKEFIGVKPFKVTITDKFKVNKTDPQRKYVHLIIKDYLTDVLYDHGNIDCKSEHLAKEWIKEYCGYGENKTLKFKGVARVRFVAKSFSDASKSDLMDIISAITRICAMVGVVIPEPEDFKLTNGE